MSKLNELRNRCGSGWLVCRAYHDYVDDSYMAWDNDNNLPTRMTAYNGIKELGEDFLITALALIQEGNTTIQYNSNSNGLIGYDDIRRMIVEILNKKAESII